MLPDTDKQCGLIQRLCVLQLYVFLHNFERDDWEMFPVTFQHDEQPDASSEQYFFVEIQQNTRAKAWHLQCADFGTSKICQNLFLHGNYQTQMCAHEGT